MEKQIGNKTRSELIAESIAQFESMIADIDAAIADQPSQLAYVVRIAGVYISETYKPASIITCGKWTRNRAAEFATRVRNGRPEDRGESVSWVKALHEERAQLVGFIDHLNGLAVAA